MSELTRFDNATWDKFFDFLYDEETLSRKEVQEELRRYGIDTNAAFNRVKYALKAREARAQLAAARQNRTNFLTKLKCFVKEPIDVAKFHLKEMIAQRLPGEEQLVYFRKLDSANSQEDLESLAEDLQNLDLFADEDKNAGAK